MPQKKYVIAVKYDRTGAVPPGWQDQLAKIPGVKVEGAFGRRAQFLADSDAIQRVRQQFSDNFLIEEVAERAPM